MNRVSTPPLFRIAGPLLLSVFIVSPFVQGGIVGAKPKATYVFNLTAPVERKDLAFEDGIVKMAFTITRSEIVLSVSNLAKSSIKVNWGEVAYVDPLGQSHNMTHSQQPAVLPPTANTTDTMVPADFIYSYGTGKVMLWQRRDFLPRPTKKEARKYNGRSFSLFIPIQIDGAIKNYLLTFTVRIADG